MRILVVEDEKKVLTFIRKALEQAGMLVDGAATCPDMLSFLENIPYDIIVLDRLVGKDDSLMHIPAIRHSQPDVKILVLSALSDVDDRVKGLTEGADDYLGKPFHVEELVARIRTLARRRQAAESSGKDTAISYDDLKIDLSRQKVFRGDKPIDLTKKEFQILTLLARRPGEIFSKAAILEQAWDMNHYPESNIVEVAIANLRAKVDRGFKPLLHSRRGVGYWLGER